MDGAGTNMCKAVNIEGVAIKATYCSRVCVGDSDDSDTEGGLGNVERVVMRPPGHSGKAKRGHLCFDAAFETGNLGRVDFITENEYDLFIRPDTGNPRIRFWFHFSVENVQADQRIIFNIVNLSKTKNLFQKGMTPVVKSTSRPRWQRLPSHQVYYYRSPEHSHNAVLSFAFAFDAQDQEKYFFALGYPYSYTRCMTMLKNLAESKGKDKMVLEERFAESVQGRPLPKVTIPCGLEKSKKKKHEHQASDDDSDDGEDETKPKSTVVIMSRMHPGESNTSYAIQGLLEFLTSDHTIARDLRKHIEIVIFPMMNPDGVFLGNSRSSLFGVDFNRSWHDTGPFPKELYPVKKFILDLTRSGRHIDFVFDFYGSPCLSGLFVQGNSFDSVYRFERHIVFPKLMAQNCPDFDVRNTMYNADVDKEGTSRRFLSGQIGEVTNVYSIEMSLFGYRTDDGGFAPYSEEDYMMHGRRIARSLWEYFKVTTVIVDPLFSAPNADSAAAGLWAATTSSTFIPSADGATKDSAFSMLRLKDISEQKDIFSSLESLGPGTSSSDDADEEEEEIDKAQVEGMIRRALRRKVSEHQQNSGGTVSFTSGSGITITDPAKNCKSPTHGTPKHGDWLVVGTSIPFERPSSGSSCTSSDSEADNDEEAAWASEQRRLRRLQRRQHRRLKDKPPSRSHLLEGTLDVTSITLSPLSPRREMEPSLKILSLGLDDDPLHDTSFIDVGRAKSMTRPRRSPVLQRRVRPKGPPLKGTGISVVAINRRKEMD